MSYWTVVFTAIDFIDSNWVPLETAVGHSVGAGHEKEKFSYFFLGLLAETFPEPLQSLIFFAPALVFSPALHFFDVHY